MEQGMCFLPREWGPQGVSLPCHLVLCQRALLCPTEQQGLHAVPCSGSGSGEVADAVTWRWLLVLHVTCAQQG